MTKLELRKKYKSLRSNLPLNKIDDFELVIMGISTWDYGQIQEDWEGHWEDIATLNLSGKIIALRSALCG